MAIFTYNEILKKTGATPKDVSFAPSVEPEDSNPVKKTVFQKIKESLGKSGDAYEAAVKDNSKTPIQRGVAATKASFGGAVDVADNVTDVIPGARTVKDTIGKVAGKAVGAIADNKVVQAYSKDLATSLGGENNVKLLADTGGIANDIIGLDAGVKGAKETGKFAAETTENTAKKVNQVATDATNRVLDGVESKVKSALPKGVSGIKDTVSDIVTPIAPEVESVLNPTKLIPKDKLKDIPIDKMKFIQEDKKVKLDKYVKQGEDAINSNYQKTPMSMAGDQGTKAATLIENKINKQALLKKEALGAVGDRVVSNVNEVTNLLKSQLEDRVGVKINKVKNGFEIGDAEGRASKVAFDPADNKLITDTYAALNKLGNKPTVRMIDDTVDALQDLLYKRKGITAVPVNGQVEGVLKNITGILNKNVKKVAGEQYTKANAKMAHMMDTFENLNKSLGHEGERGANLMKSLFSPSGEKPRRLFSEVKKLTGIDLTEEATLAKFVMESLGDSKQASLLAEIIKGRTMSPTGIIEKGFDKAVGAMQDPIGKARRIISESVK